MVVYALLSSFDCDGKVLEGVVKLSGKVQQVNYSIKPVGSCSRGTQQPDPRTWLFREIEENIKTYEKNN